MTFNKQRVGLVVFSIFFLVVMGIVYFIKQEGDVMNDHQKENLLEEKPSLQSVKRYQIFYDQPNKKILKAMSQLDLVIVEPHF